MVCQKDLSCADKKCIYILHIIRNRGQAQWLCANTLGAQGGCCQNSGLLSFVLLLQLRPTQHDDCHNRDCQVVTSINLPTSITGLHIRNMALRMSQHCWSGVRNCLVCCLTLYINCQINYTSKIILDFKPHCSVPTHNTLRT